MPRLDGFGLLRAIRDDSALASTPVILLSARAGEESRVEGLQADADDYLVKPFSARELLARVATHVKMANLRRETAEREERLRSEAELEREKLRASEERLMETSRLYRELEDRERRSGVWLTPTFWESRAGMSRVPSWRPMKPFFAWCNTTMKMSLRVACDGGT